MSDSSDRDEPVDRSDPRRDDRSDPRRDDRVEQRAADLLPEEIVAGSADPRAQAAAILEDSDEREATSAAGESAGTGDATL